MRILTVNNTADRYGASRCMERVLGPMAEAGHEIHAVLPEHGPLALLLEQRGVHVHVHADLPVIDRNHLKTLSGCLRFVVGVPRSVLFLAKLIRHLNIEVVHTNTVVLPTPSLAAFFTGRPHVWHVREILAEFGSLWRPYQHWICGISAAVVAVSECVRDQFAPKPRVKVRVIYDGLDETTGVPNPSHVAAFRRRLPADAVLVGVVGRLKWHRKGQEVLVHAAALLRDRFPDCHYVLVGKPSLGNEEHETRLRSLISDLGLVKIVHLMGEADDTASVFAALDVAVAPSVQPEPFGCVVIEAMAAGTAVVGSKTGGIAEQIVHGESGLLFTPGDAQDLADQLAILLTDPVRRQRIAANGNLRVRSHFQLGSTISALLALFESVHKKQDRNWRLRPPVERAHRRGNAATGYEGT